MYRNASMINVLTPAFEKTLIEKKGVPAQKVIMIPNAADFCLSDHLLNTVNKEAFRKQLGWEGKFVIVYVGAHGVANHLEQMVETAALVKDEPVHFVLIGDGMRKNAMKQLAASMQLTNLEFIDPVNKDKVYEYIISADAGCSVLKKVDTFKTIYSNKTFDYMGCQTPIFMLIDGISRELVEKAQAGIYVEPENAPEFAEKIRWALRHRDEIKQMGMNGYAYAKVNLHRSVLAARYLDNLVQLGK